MEMFLHLAERKGGVTFVEADAPLPFDLGPLPAVAGDDAFPQPTTKDTDQLLDLVVVRFWPRSLALDVAVEPPDGLCVVPELDPLAGRLPIPSSVS